MKPILDKRTYKRERAICDKAAAYWEANATHTKSGSSLSAELAKHPDYAACNNAMRGRVEQYELLTDTPAEIFAYICHLTREERDSTNFVNLWRYRVTTFAGDVIGTARKTSRWKVYSYVGSHMFQFYATINGREFTGRGFGEGMCIRLKETAASKRTRS